MFVIFDLDGTLANIEHRLHHLDKEDMHGNKRKPDWDSFHQFCTRDLPIWPIIRIFKALREQRHTVEIWSGRSDKVRAETQNWLTAHEIHPDNVMMRPAGDNTPDHQLKERWLHKLIADGITPDLVFDDRARLVEMWRRNGIQCCQVAEGQF